MKTTTLLLPILTCVLPFSAGQASLTPADLTEQAAPYLQGQGLQAASMGVIQPGGTVVAHVGTLEPGGSEPPTSRTLYEIGSVTKVFTSLLLADAVVRGELELETTIAALLPAEVVLPHGAGDRITLRMLATHTSGLPRVPPEIPSDDYGNPYANYTEAGLWETLRRVKLDFEPGTKASYSNLAAGLLGTLLARHAGLTYERLLFERVTQPLGMADTVIEPGAALRERFAPPFTAAGERWSHWDFQALAGAGGIRSTLDDMLRLAAAVLHPKDTPLQKAIEFAWERKEPASKDFPGGLALGWLIAGDGRTRWHNGMTGGYHAAIFLNRELDVATVVLGNRSTPAGTALAESLVRRAAGIPDRPVPNRDRPEVTLTADQLDRCVGTFRVSPAMALVVERRNLSLYVTPTGQATDRLYAASADTFFSRRVPAELVFELPPEGGPATALVLKQGGREARAAREPARD